MIDVPSSSLTKTPGDCEHRGPGLGPFAGFAESVTFSTTKLPGNLVQVHVVDAPDDAIVGQVYQLSAKQFSVDLGLQLKGVTGTKVIWVTNDKRELAKALGEIQ